jgi:hypothetical protein
MIIGSESHGVRWTGGVSTLAALVLVITNVITNILISSSLSFGLPFLTRASFSNVGNHSNMILDTIWSPIKTTRISYSKCMSSITSWISLSHMSCKTTYFSLSHFISSTLALTLNNLLSLALRLSFSTTGSHMLLSIFSLKNNLAHTLSPQVTAAMFLFLLQDLGIPNDSRARVAVLVGEHRSFRGPLADREDGVRSREGALSEGGDGAMATVVT